MSNPHILTSPISISASMKHWLEHGKGYSVHERGLAPSPMSAVWRSYAQRIAESEDSEVEYRRLYGAAKDMDCVVLLGGKEAALTAVKKTSANP